MVKYLSPNTEQILIEERKCIFRCRVDDIDVKGNRKWKYEDISCSSCKMNVEETQFQILNCKFLLGKKRKCFLYTKLF